MGFLIYIIGTVDAIKIAFYVISIMSVSILFITIGAKASCGDMDDFNPRTLKKIGVICSILLFLGLFIPDGKTVAAMYLLPKLSKSEIGGELQKIPDKALKVLNLKMDEYINSISKIENKE